MCLSTCSLCLSESLQMHILMAWHFGTPQGRFVDGFSGSFSCSFEVVAETSIFGRIGLKFSHFDIFSELSSLFNTDFTGNIELFLVRERVKEWQKSLACQLCKYSYLPIKQVYSLNFLGNICHPTHTFSSLLAYGMSCQLYF